MKLVIATQEGSLVFDELLGSIEGLEIVRVDSTAEALPELGDADVFYGFPSDEVVATAPNLRLLQTPSAGVDFLMRLHALRESDIPLANTRGAHAPSIAEHAFSLLLALTRGLPSCFGWQKDKEWPRSLEIYRMPREIMGSTMGIIGYGEIGRAIAQRASAFGMKILAVDAHPKFDAPYVGDVWPVDRLHEMLAESDVVAVAAPLTKETHHVLNAAAFAAMKPGCYLIAISRGGVVDEGALADALELGHLAGAGLDVAEIEPLDGESRLWNAPNLIITPHLAGSSLQKETRCVAILRENIMRLQKGEPLINLVDKQLGY